MQRTVKNRRRKAADKSAEELLNAGLELLTNGKSNLGGQAPLNGSGKNTRRRAASSALSCGPCKFAGAGGFLQICSNGRLLPFFKSRFLPLFRRRLQQLLQLGGFAGALFDALSKAAADPEGRQTRTGVIK
jgi:hypothetical protein